LRYSPAVMLDYTLSTVPGVLSLQNCVGQDFAPKTTEDVKLAQVSWTCGAEMRITGGLLSWAPNDVTCDLNSVCSLYPPSKCSYLDPLVVEAPLVADFAASPVCLGEPTVFTDGTTGGRAPYTYAWTFGDGATSSAANPTHAYGAAGSYDVTLTVTDSQSPPVVDSQTYSVTVNANPTAGITPASPVLTCKDPSVVLTASGAGTYRWSTGATTQSITVNTAGTYTVTVTNAAGCTDTASVVVTADKAAPTASITPSALQLTCDVKSVTLTGGASGGTGAYTYSWSTGATTKDITVTTPGTYTLTVKGANGCTDTESVTITQDVNAPSVEVTATATELTCTTTSSLLTAEMTGGTAPFTYAWSTNETSESITVSKPGTYSVTVTGANGCEDTDEIVITQDIAAPSVVIEATEEELNCEVSESTLTAMATGGTAPLTYAWSTGETTSSIVVDAPGTYTVTVTGANGCTDEDSYTVTQDLTAPSVVIDATAEELTCAVNASTLTANVTGGIAPLHYLWSTGATSDQIVVTEPGTYSVTVTGANGCTDTDEITITEDVEPPSVTVTATATELTCEVTSSTLTAVLTPDVGTGPFTYLWNTAATTPSISVTEPGTYSVVVTGANGCSSTASIVLTENKPPEISVTKTANPTSVPETGADVTFTYQVKNEGCTAVTITALDDDQFGALAGDADCQVGTVLAAGASCAFDATLAVPGGEPGAAHVNEFSATAEADGKTDTAKATATVTYTQVAVGLSVVKTADPETATVGDEITYTYVVRNTGDVTLYDATLEDDLLGKLSIPEVLEPGAQATATAKHVVTEEDLPGPIVNVATATASTAPPQALMLVAPETLTATATASVTLTYTNGLSLTKTPSVTYADIDETIAYTYDVANTGNVTLYDLTLVDDVLGAITLPVDTLAPGASTSGTATHVVAEGDLPGPIVNVATVSAVNTLQEPVTAEDTATVAVGSNPVLAITKTGPDSPQQMGAVLAYEIVVTNAGDVTLTNVIVTDPMLGIDQNVGNLAPGASKTVEGTYTVTEGDIPEGLGEEDTSFQIVNTATADSDQTEPVSDAWTVTVNYEFYVPQVGLAIDKTGPASAQIGDTIVYTIKVTNTGETDLANVTVTDAKLGLSKTIALLAAGASESFTGSYGPVTEADLPGPIVNTATASQAQAGEVQDTWTVELGANPGLQITKTGPATVVIGGTIPYTIAVKNTGDVTLENVRVVDAKLGLEETIASLAPGATETLSGSYGPVTEADLPGPVLNTATASHPDVATVQDSWDVPIITGPALAIDKTGPEEAEVGDEITYKIVVTNVGNVTLHNVVVVDERLGFGETLEALAPGAPHEFTLTYTVGEADLTSDLMIHNVATADSDETGPVSDSHDVRLKDFEQEPEPEPEACVRSDVAVIIYGGWNGIPVKAWASGAEQPTQHTAMNAFGEPQATWTFWPGEGETWTVNVEPQLPADLDPARWQLKALSSTSVSFGRCQSRTIYFQLMDNGTPPAPTPVPAVPSLPQTGGMDSGAGTWGSALVGLGLLGVALTGAWLLRRRITTAGTGR
ncbi:MAG: DUF11 domain-containing protein, partial [Chloroflexi bacterium]|nr:DUF11 domain-containing protein [Chloroflexota bacterium]